MPTYDIVISFAGEDRLVAEAIASQLRIKGLKVFYDDYEQANLWGKDLYTHLTKIYRDEAKYCLMLLSKNYSKKQWTNHERKAAQSRAFSENREYILPLKLDNTSVDGILDTTGYIDYSKVKFEKLIDMISDKIYQYNKDNGIPYNIVKVEDIFNQLINDKTKVIKDEDLIGECPTCRSKQLLSEAQITVEDDDTIYTCKYGCQRIIVISRPGVTAWPGRGYRVGDNVIRNACALNVKGTSKVIPARTASLMKRKP